jgi:amino acid permease
MYNDDLNDILIIYFKKDIIFYYNNNKIILSAILMICEIALFFNAIFSLPLLFFPLKNNVFNIILLVKNYNNNENNNNNEIIISNNKNLITFLTYITVLIFALLMKKNLFIENIIGSTANNFISFILPSIFLLKIDKKNTFKFLKILSITTFFFGLTTLIIFFYLQINNLINN